MADVIDESHLTTWSVSGPDLQELSARLTALPEVEQAAVFGDNLHVSGDDPIALEHAIEPFRREPYKWRTIDTGLEDVFIHYMGASGQDEPIS